MQRNVDITEIWDGRFYGPDDRVRIGCQECAGCSDCCRTTGDSIILDPYDLYLLQQATGKTFQQMVEHEIEIRLADGMILPNIMEHDETNPARKDGCPFLDADGRCSIHAFRPGFCRLFPMGRFYVDKDTALPSQAGTRFYRAGIRAFEQKKPARYFCYFLQRNECSKKDSPRYKVRLRDWLDMPDLEKYEDYIVRWHFFLKDVSQRLNLLSDEARDPIARYILQIFFVDPYQTNLNFYAQFEIRLARAKMLLAPLDKK